MKWVLICGGVLVALVIVVCVVGALLPKAHVASRTATYRQRPEALWATITDFAGAPSWRPGVRKVDVEPPSGEVTHFVEEGEHGKIRFEVLERDAPGHMVTRIADTGLPFGGRWTYEIRSEGNGARVTITENGEVYNPLFRFLSRFVFGYTSTLDTYLEALGKKHGEAVTPGPA